MSEPPPVDAVADDRVLTLLTGALDEFDAPTDDLVTAAVAAFTLRTLGAELLALLGEQPADEPAGAMRDGGDGPDVLVYGGPGCTVEVELDHGDPVRILGRVDELTGATVVVIGDGGRHPVAVDDLGRFAVDWPPGRIVRIEVTAADGRRLATDAFRT